MGWVNGVPEEVRLKISKTFKERGYKPPSRKGKPPWNKGKNVSGMSGKHHSEETKRKISEAQKGIPREHTRGKQHPNWKGGSTARDMRELKYTAWRLAVFERDAFTCQMPGCGKRGGRLNSHHIRTWKDFPELRYDVSNGITLCESCHNLTKGKEESFGELFEEIVRLIAFTRS